MKKIIAPICTVFLFGLAIIGVLFLDDRKYMLISMLAAITSCVPFFIKSEKKTSSERELVTIAVMIALSVCFRFIFAPLQHFKPVTAMTIISGMYLGCDAGFVTGSLTAVISNIYYGQGPWTPFQMAVWGIIGFISGLLRKKIGNNKPLLLAFSGLCGILFSLLMDIWTTLSIDNVFSFARYLTFVASSLPVMAEYVISNIIFMLLLQKPIGNKLERLCVKYGMFTEKKN